MALDRTALIECKACTLFIDRPMSGSQKQWFSGEISEVAKSVSEITGGVRAPRSV